ncbi:hypothetical protein GGX14DRAFT_677594 [Mycena pura]|uniref:BTB domain-containing protein n=1 Tax=Mycena pura TaxID=153505 RepID=A0AAD6UYG6_9AGAR|nr:hypothetical protein GGX14DRAFT_677594 [Mycena pura]
MDSPPAAKRPRSDSDPAGPVTRSKIWYSDGSIVLQAEAVQFRVHTSILSAASSVFRDMLEVAQGPADIADQVEGCPLVHLSDDKAVDVGFVLEALYDRNFYKTKKKTFGQVEAMWRLGKKYGFDELRDDAVGRLQYIFPSTLADMHARYWSPDTPVDFGMSKYPGFSFDAVNLARATGLISILPTALIISCLSSSDLRTAQEKILSGRPRGDGSTAHLSGEDKALCILAMSDLLRKQWDGPYAWLHKSSCLNTNCRALREDLKTAIWTPIPRFVSLNRRMVDGSFCEVCKQYNLAVFTVGQRALWEELPSVFGLPSWEDIAKEMECV